MSPRLSRRDTTERFPDAPLDGPLLEVTDVKTSFKTERGLVRAEDRGLVFRSRGTDLEGVPAHGILPLARRARSAAVRGRALQAPRSGARSEPQASVVTAMTTR